jgi:hypothetical protein
VSAITNRLQVIWLHFLRYGVHIDLDAARRSGNTNEKVWCVNRIAQLDREIDIRVIAL